MEPSEQESPIWQLFVRLRRRRFLVGIEDYGALKQALRAGFGWSSRESLRSLCSLLWAKSRSEREVLEALFDQIEFPVWDSSEVASVALSSTEDEFEKPLPGLGTNEVSAVDDLAEPGRQGKPRSPATRPSRGLPPINLEGVLLSDKPFVFVPHFSLTPRDVAQLGRYLRHPHLSGPPEDVDVNATIALRCRQGIIGSIVLKPRKQNTSRLLSLIDRQGSMAPFHRLVEMVTDTLAKSDSSRGVTLYYFHDVPVEGADDRILSSVRENPFPVLDDVLNQITPLTEGYLYEDRELLSPVALADVLRSFAVGSTVLFLSDAGAARRGYDPQRLLDTLGFVKALRLYTQRYVWLNPLPRTSWVGSTAAQIARHIPMFSLDFEGFNHAARALRGQYYSVENRL